MIMMNHFLITNEPLFLRKRSGDLNFISRRGALLLLMMLFLPLQMLGYVVTGKIVDASGKPIRKAVVIGKNKEGVFRIGIETDENGQFGSVNVNDSALSLEISKEGLMPVYMDVVGTPDAYLDLGTVYLSQKSVKLDEVTVTAQSVTQKATGI